MIAQIVENKIKKNILKATQIFTMKYYNNK